jgi:cellulose synthase/poly-beta-1,6-N-acetylglucosamine synthase-like glycosyltransferase
VRDRLPERRRGDPPRVSVLLPARDAAATLGTALRSVSRQRGVALECVLVDDGSRDATLAVARTFAARDPRFRVIAQPRRGLVAALERGLAACRGEVVARLDADDWMHRDRLVLQLAELDAHPELAGVGCHVRLFPRRGLRAGRRAYERWLNSVDSPRRVRLEAFVECPLAHPGLALRREVLARYGYRDLGWPEDYDLLLRLLADGHALGVVPRRLLAWRDGPGRLSRTSPTYAQARFTACKAAFLARGFLARDAAYVLWGFGATGKALFRELLAHGKRPALIVELHPRRLGETIHGAAVVPPEALRGLPRRPVVASVAGAAARAEIRAAAAALGLEELRDFVCAA